MDMYKKSRIFFLQFLSVKRIHSAIIIIAVCVPRTHTHTDVVWGAGTRRNKSVRLARSEIFNYVDFANKSHAVAQIVRIKIYRVARLSTCAHEQLLFGSEYTKLHQKARGAGVRSISCMLYIKSESLGY